MRGINFFSPGRRSIKFKSAPDALWDFWRRRVRNEASSRPKIAFPRASAQMSQLADGQMEKMTWWGVLSVTSRGGFPRSREADQRARAGSLRQMLLRSSDAPNRPAHRRLSCSQIIGPCCSLRKICFCGGGGLCLSLALHLKSTFAVRSGAGKEDYFVRVRPECFCWVEFLII